MLTIPDRSGNITLAYVEESLTSVVFHESVASFAKNVDQYMAIFAKVELPSGTVMIPFISD